MQELLLEAKSRLRQENYRLTTQREVILELLVRHPRRHFTAEEIRESLRRNHPQLGLSTVYRTLVVLEDLGIVGRIDVGDGKSRYEFYGAGSQPHCHLVCLECGRMTEAHYSGARLVEELLWKEKFEVKDHSLVFFGLCRSCRGTGRKPRTC